MFADGEEKESRRVRRKVDTIAARDNNLYDNIFLTYARALSVNHNGLPAGDGGFGRAHCCVAIHCWLSTNS